MNDSSSELGQRLRRRRMTLGLSRRQAAALVGCSSSTMQRIETEGQRPGPELVPRLASALGLDVRELFELAGYSMPEGLPALGPYLRMKFKDLPPRAFSEIESFVEFLRSKYGINPDPIDGLDERPDGAAPLSSRQRR